VVKLAWFTLIALLLSCLQHGRLAGWSIAPDLPLALAAWAMVDGDDDGVLVRAWIVGLCRDLADPGTDYGREGFYTIAYGCLGLAFTPVRAYLFRSRAIAWGGWAFVCALILALVDHRLGGVRMAWGATVSMALLTALAAMGLGWALGGLPEGMRPLKAGGA
jgi:hypothetical protein